MPEIYLDSNATSPVLPEALDAAVHAMRTLYGNPSSSHSAGLRARAMMEAVREQARAVLGAPAGRLLFVSGATEGIQTAVLSALHAVRDRRAMGDRVPQLLVYGATEHKAVPESLAHWNRVLGLNLQLRALPVDAQGQHDLALLAQWLPDVALLCTMAANNETGVVSDLAAIERLLAGHGGQSLWLVDCVQALGKLPLVLGESRIDYAPFSGHKLHAPKGIGLLYVRDGAPFTPLMVGGGQEGGSRSGTENMAGIAALGAVLGALQRGDTFCSHEQLSTYRGRLQASLEQAFPGIVFNAPLAGSLPTTLNFSVPGLSSQVLLDAFDGAGVRVSAGSACSASRAAPSFVLEAMGLPAWRTTSAVRLSLGALADEALVARACEAISACGLALRRSGMLADASENTAGLASEGLVPVMQFDAGGHCCWLVCDPGSRDCVVIHLLPELQERVSRHVRHHGLRVLASLPMVADAPSFHDVMVPLGPRQLCAQVIDGALAYLLRGPDGQADYAFISTEPDAAAARALPGVGPRTILCLTQDDRGVFIAAGAVVQAQAGRDQDLTLEGVQALVQGDPHAHLVDVREPHEQPAGGAVSLAGRPVHGAPLSQLASFLPGWLHSAGGDAPTLVFLCRSGARSLKAVQCLRSHGHARVHQLAGGLAGHPPAWIPLMGSGVS